jgi:tRNA A-37 threonylcarbamoyl transferase component Bud32
VQRIHAKGVVHGDLRKENFVVLDRSSERSISLIDFSHCRFTTDASAQWLELCELERLFDAL